jgi:hypothetical protein
MPKTASFGNQQSSFFHPGKRDQEHAEDFRIFFFLFMTVLDSPEPETHNQVDSKSIRQLDVLGVSICLLSPRLFRNSRLAAASGVSPSSLPPEFQWNTCPCVTIKPIN